MLVRAPTAAALALSAAPTARMARSDNADNADISGKCCGVAVSGTVWPPATARAITSSRDTTDEARLTAVVVPGATVQVTAVGDGASVRADLNRCGADGNMVHDGRMPPVHPARAGAPQSHAVRCPLLRRPLAVRVDARLPRRAAPKWLET